MWCTTDGDQGCRPERGEVRPGVQALEDLPDGHPFVREPPIDHADQVSLALVDHEVARHRLAARHVPIAVRGTAALVVALSGLLQFAAAEPLTHHGALVFRDGALDLQEQLVVRVIRDRVLQERHLAAGLAELLEQQHLVRVSPREAVGAQHRDVLDGAVAGRVAQGIKAGPVKARAAVSLVAEDVRLVEFVAPADRPGPQGCELAADGLLALLPLGGHTGVDGDVHGGSPLMLAPAGNGGALAAAVPSSRRR
nr:hypothetical protein [Siccirubricoccus sp. G192]